MEGEFTRQYHAQYWAGPSGELVGGKVKIARVKESNFEVSEGTSLASLPELNPPHVMPRGNVGTPLTVFMGLIRTCKLPSIVIKKLQLEFPKSRSQHKYGAVPFEYATLDKGDLVITADDEHDAEDWERFEALHDDVDKQGRTRERLYEEELEVVWDKGGSGLVFHTDAAFWRGLEETDFDEETADDKDIDMGAYYGFSEVELDRDARQQLDMSREQRLRRGEQVKGIGAFEQHTKGIGSNVMRQKGWCEGRGLGRDMEGISEPVETLGQLPHCKRGLGYRGEKLSMGAVVKKKRKATKDVLISTAYDWPDEHVDTELQSAPPTSLKYRQRQPASISRVL